MPINHNTIGRRFGPFRLHASRNCILAFAKAIGETRAICTSLDAAQAAGYRDLVAPSTFPFAVQFLEMDAPMSFQAEIGATRARIVHAEQRIETHAPICAGDDLVAELTILDIVVKKDRHLTFIKDEMVVYNQLNELVARLVRTCAERSV